VIKYSSLIKILRRQTMAGQKRKLTKEEKEIKRAQNLLFFPVTAAIGAALGLTIGSLAGHRFIGALIGAIAGLAIGLRIDVFLRKK